METWRQSAAGRRFIEAVAVARVLERVSLVAGQPPGWVPHPVRITGMTGDVEMVARLREAALDVNFPEIEATAFRRRLAGSLPAFLAVAAARAIYVVMEGQQATQALNAFMSHFERAECDRLTAEWTALVGRSRRRDREAMSRAIRQTIRSDLSEYVAAWVSPELPTPILPKLLGPPAARADFTRAIAGTLEGRLLSLVTAWRSRLGTPESAFDEEVDCELDRWALNSLLLVIWSSLSTLTSTSLEAALDEAREDMIVAAMGRHQISDFVGAPFPGERVFPPFLSRQQIADHVGSDKAVD